MRCFISLSVVKNLGFCCFQIKNLRRDTFLRTNRSVFNALCASSSSNIVCGDSRSRTNIHCSRLANSRAPISSLGMTIIGCPIIYTSPNQSENCPLATSAPHGRCRRANSLNVHLQYGRIKEFCNDYVRAGVSVTDQVQRPAWLRFTGTDSISELALR